MPPETSDREIFVDVSGKKRQGKKGKGVKIEKKRRKIVKGRVENWKWKLEKFLLVTFENDGNLFGSTKMGIFYR